MKNHGLEGGNIQDKYTTKNIVFRYLMNNFLFVIRKFAMSVGNEVDSIVEVGCGEGHLTSFIDGLGIAPIRGFDSCPKIIDLANNINKNLVDIFFVEDIYTVSEERYRADLVFCCEVLEHLEHPELALKKLQKLAGRYLILSVPNEPIWRILNCLRGKYLSSWGNTPGHINHWSVSSFKKFISKYFKIKEMKKSLPWTIVLCEKI